VRPGPQTAKCLRLGDCNEILLKTCTACLGVDDDPRITAAANWGKKEYQQFGTGEGSQNFAMCMRQAQIQEQISSTQRCLAHHDHELEEATLNQLIIYISKAHT
jgi:hypothetical protein